MPDLPSRSPGLARGLASVLACPDDPRPGHLAASVRHDCEVTLDAVRYLANLHTLACPADVVCLWHLNVTALQAPSIALQAAVASISVALNNAGVGLAWLAARSRSAAKDGWSGTRAMDGLSRHSLLSCPTLMSELQCSPAHAWKVHGLQ